MNIYDISYLASVHDGEYVLGAEDLHTHACYLIYGFLKPGESGRIIKPGEGHEEIVCLVRGEVFLSKGSENIILRQGHAFHLKDDETYLMDNNGKADAVYIIAGGHGVGHTH